MCGFRPSHVCPFQVQRDVLEDELTREKEEAERLQQRLHELKAVPQVSFSISCVNLQHWAVGGGWSCSAS